MNMRLSPLFGFARLVSWQHVCAIPASLNTNVDDFFDGQESSVSTQSSNSHSQTFAEGTGRPEYAENGWTLVPPDLYPALPDIPAAHFSSAEARFARSLVANSRQRLARMMANTLQSQHERNSSAGLSISSTPGFDYLEAPQEALDDQFAVLETSGYEVLQQNTDSSLGQAAEAGSLEQISSPRPDPRKLPKVTIQQPMMALQHDSGARVSQLLRPGQFIGWYRSNADRVVPAIPTLTTVKEIELTCRVVLGLLHGIDFLGGDVKFFKKLDLDQSINVEVEYFKENLTVDFKDLQTQLGIGHTQLDLMLQMPDSGNETVGRLFIHMIKVERSPSGAVRWWPGRVLKYQLVQGNRSSEPYS